MYDFQRRRDLLVAKLAETGADAMLVTDLTNVRYLTGFSGDSTYLLLTAAQAWLLSDSRYDTQIAQECPDLELVSRTAAREMVDLVAETLRSAGVSSVAIESDAMSKWTFDLLSAAAAQIRWIDTHGMVQAQRAVKDSDEIQVIRQAVRMAQTAFLQWRAQLSGELSERAAAYRLENEIRRLGGEGQAFDTIVAVDDRAALPHAGATDHQLAGARSILVDWGARFQGYHSDLTRVLLLAPPSPQLEEIHRVVVAAQRAAIAMIRPGVETNQVDGAARQVIAQAGYGPAFGHGLGHGFGLQIHEQPRLSPLATGTLAPGMVVTVEPGIYLPGQCGVRIEDDVLVTADGCEVLSDLPQSLQDNWIVFG